MEEANLQNLIDFDRPPLTFGFMAAGAHNEEVAKHVVPAFVCPTDGERVPGSEFGAISYPATAGTGLVDDGSIRQADGVIFEGSRIRVAHITDGTSKTVAFSEQVLGSGQETGAPQPQDGVRQVAELAGEAPTTPEACATANRWAGDRGDKWINGHYGDSMYNHFYPPNASVPDCHNGHRDHALTAARSLHPGGVHTALCDGSVRFAASDIGLDLWRALATRDGQELASQF